METRFQHRLLTSVIALLFISSFVLFGDRVAADTIKISSPPSVWIQEKDGQLTGPLIDLLEDIFSEMGVDVATFSLPWARAIAQLRDGKIDMIPIIFYTKERSEFVEFSKPFAQVPTAVFVPAGESFSFASVSDLVGKKGLIMKGDSISEEFETIRPQLQIDEIAGYDQMVRMLADRRADYAVAAQYGFAIELKRSGLESKITLLPQPVSSRDLHFAISKQSPFVQYVPTLNKKLQQLEERGELKKMVERTIEKAATN